MASIYQVVQSNMHCGMYHHNCFQTKCNYKKYVAKNYSAVKRQNVEWHSAFNMGLYSLFIIRRHQIFVGGPRTKMKKSSENFCAPPARKKRSSQIFRLRRAFFRCGGTENPSALF